MAKSRQQVIDVLESAAFVLRQPENWTQGSAVRDDADRHMNDLLAWPGAKWCAVGALYVANADLGYESDVYNEAFDAVSRVLQYRTLAGFNDAARNSDEVADLMLRAAEGLRR